MIKKGGLFAAAALVVLLATSHSFSFVPQSQQRCPSALNAEQDSSQESTTSVSSRRGFFSQVAATASASLLLSSSPQQATAASDELPTRIELSVDTEYMIQALDYFDGDMRKVIEVLIRAPSTEVQIEPPASTLFDAGPKDAILSALSSYNEDPEYAARQASWIKVDKPNRTLDFLLKKRYDLSVPSAGPKSAQEIEIVLKDGGTLKYKPMKLDTTPFSLSNLEAGVGLAVVSYPIAYGVYNYDSWKEEQDKKEKKAQMAAKKAAKAKAKAAAAKAKAKGTPKKKKEKKEAKDDTAKKFAKQVMKGEEKKSPKVDNAPVDVNFDGKSEEWFLSEATLKAAIEKPKPAADASVDTSNESEWFGRDVSESKIVALVEEAETVLMQEIAQQGGYLDNLSPPSSKGQVTSKKQVTAKKREYKKSGSFGSYLDSL